MTDYQFVYRRRQNKLFLGANEYRAVSGPYGKGPLPPGEYHTSTTLAPNMGHYFPDGFRVDDTAYGIKLEPQFPTDRSGLWIHPDGNQKGTLGCIGIAPGDALSFWHAWKGLNPGWQPVVLYVEDRTIDIQPIPTLPIQIQTI